MNVLRCSRSVALAARSCHRPRVLPVLASTVSIAQKKFHAGSALWGTRSQVLKDVGEGITEVQIIQWYVEEGGHIEEWKPLCQYQSDKAVDDITSRYEGVVKKLHFQADDTVPTGKALCDIEVDDAQYPDDSPAPQPAAEPEPAKPSEDTQTTTSQDTQQPPAPEAEAPEAPAEAPRSKYASLATPAVRGLLKTLNVNILDVTGTGKDGRVLKEDVQKFVAKRDSAPTTPAAAPSAEQSETEVKLTPFQSQMFKTMTKSLSIPHFLYADELKVNDITAMRRKLANDPKDPRKITFLSFVIKAVSMALNDYPVLNAKVDMSNSDKPSLIMRSKHNIGVAMDTPSGLIVPNIKDVASRSIMDIASEISRLSELGKSGKLTPADLSGGTITVSNIGNIGGTYVAPVIVPNEVAILGVGRSRTVPAFDDAGQVTKSEVANFSWSADHRIVDGATMARMGGRVRQFIESPELMLMNMR